MKENIAVIFGGKSAEHDISIITGLQTISNVDRDKYNIIPIYIDKTNNFFAGENLCFLQNFMPFSESSAIRVSFIAGTNYLFSKTKTKKIYFDGEKEFKKNRNTKPKNPTSLKKLVKIDCAINCCHGKSGEDGSLAGLLALCGIPSTSCGVLSAAICMDKICMKDILKANEIDSAKYFSFNKTQYILDENEIINEIETNIGYPVFIKPSTLGSSIGISKCYSREELEIGIEVALNYDERILVEKSIENNIEINCAVIGNKTYAEASEIELPNKTKAFLTFDEKYIQRQEAAENKKPNINVSKEIQQKVKDMAKKAFKVFDCKGVVRIDFLYSKSENKLYLNELNTIPGSLAFYLFKNEFNFKQLTNKLIVDAIKEKQNEDLLSSNFKSNALNNFNNSLKQHK